MDPLRANNENGSSSNVIEERITKPNGEFAIKRYAKGKLLGKGGFAKCHQVTDLETNKVSAAKIIVKSSLSKTRARQKVPAPLFRMSNFLKLISEIKIHKSLQHTNIVSFEHVFEDQENVYILLELCTNQTLSELIKRRKRLTELEVQCYLMQIIQALKYMHSNRIIHRDLKLGNLFVSDKMEIKVGDFGLAAKVEFEGEKKKTICGTPNYIAPEILEGKVGHSYEVDVWSVGVIMYTLSQRVVFSYLFRYTLLIGKPPFETPDVKTTYKKIRMNSYSFPDHIPLSEAAKSIITKTLTLDPCKRPGLDEMLEHPFLNNPGSIPKLLPVSTIVCPPSASYVKQFLPQAAEVKVAVQPQRLIDTAPSSQQNAKLSSNQRPNMINTDRTAPKKLQNNENIQNDKQPNTARGDVGWTNSTPGAINFNTLGGNGVIKPSTAQPKGFGSSIGLKTLQSASNLMATTGTGNAFQKEFYTSRTDVYVKKWVDYSSKYGLGYLLSNGSVGVFFNDSSKILLEPKGCKFDYIQRSPQDKQEIIKSHTLADYPKDLQKKVTLLQHFKSYLEGDIKQNAPANDEVVVQSDSLIYVKKWMKTKHAIIFRLNNKVVQVDFADKTEIILSSENKLVVYVNKKGERTQYPLATALESPNVEMTKRLKYTKEILAHILSPNQQVDNKVQDNPGLCNQIADVGERFAENVEIKQA